MRERERERERKIDKKRKKEREKNIFINFYQLENLKHQNSMIYIFVSCW